MQLRPPNRHDWMLASALLMILALCYALSQPALAGPFLFDDFPNFANLREISGCFTGDRLANYLAVFVGSPGRPLSALSFLINDVAWPSTPYDWKRTNLLLHLICGILVFGLTRVLASARHSTQVADWVAAGTAAAWLLHPMQLSTTMLTVQRMTQLMALTTLATCWWVARAITKPALPPRTYMGILVVVYAMTVIAFLCKENGALLPGYAALTSYWMRSQSGTAVRDSGYRAFLGMLLLPIAAIVGYLVWKGFAWVDDGTRDFDVAERLMTQGRILWSYVGQILIPRLNGTGLFHDDIVVSRSLLMPASTLVAGIALLAVAAVAALQRQKTPLLTFAVLWYLGGHLLESTTLSLELYFEHRNYLPMVGPLAAVGIGIASVGSRDLRRALVAAAIAWLALAGSILRQSAPVWGSQLLLSRIWANEHPDSTRAREFLAKDQFESGDAASARRTLTDAIRKHHRFGVLAGHVLLIDCQIGRLTAAKVDWATQLAARSPFNRSTLDALSMLRTLTLEGHCADPSISDAWLRGMESLLASPAYQSADIQGYIHFELAQEGIRRRNYSAVMQHLHAAFKVSPSIGLARSIAAVLQSGGYPLEARRWQSRAAAMQPDWPIPWWNRFKILFKLPSQTCPVS